MNTVLFNNIDLMINEHKKEILVNPKGERFYFVKCEESDTIFTDAILSLTQEGRYEITGYQTLYTEHRDSGFSHHKLLCLHPQELIKRHSFLGVVWFSVNGVMTRSIRTCYRCAHTDYHIHERLEIISRSVEKEI